METGKAAPISVREFLFTFPDQSAKLRKKFVKECEKNITRFEKPIKRPKILNFESEAVKMKLITANKLKEVSLTERVFGRICCITLKHLAHLDGRISKN